MTDIDSLQEAVLELPAELAYELMQGDTVWPYVRENRVGPDVVPALLLSATTAFSTVVATKLSDGIVNSISHAIRSWLKRRIVEERTVLRAPETGTALMIDADTTDEEIAAFILQVRADQPENF